VTGAAGVAWERAVDPSTRDDEGPQRDDWAALLEAVPSLHDAETCVRAAAALLRTLGPEHQRVTRALLERDLTGADLTALAHGEQISDGE
jgi:hypothetical protein